jgi:glucosamine--fructose-6-phosphate aminotransferase (isomerizing)
MSTTPYIEEILSQPEVLSQALARWDFNPLKDLIQGIRSGRIERLVLTGMGASYFSLYPAWLSLLDTGISAVYMETAELIHYAPSLITEKTALWAVSQSGRTAEMLPLVNRAAFRPGCFLATVNDLESPLAQRADIVMPISAPAEKTTSTRTYLNSLALNQCIAACLGGAQLRPLLDAFQRTGEALAEYLSRWREQVDGMKAQLELPEHLAILGRGASLSSAWMGALILQEAAKYPAWGMNAGQFRHGPIEMADKRLSVIVMEGSPKTAELNLRLAKDLVQYGAKTVWLGFHPMEGVPSLLLPGVDLLGLLLLETAAFELLSIAFAEQKGLEAGKFFRIGKVTLSE